MILIFILYIYFDDDKNYDDKKTLSFNCNLVCILQQINNKKREKVNMSSLNQYINIYIYIYTRK